METKQALPQNAAEKPDKESIFSVDTQHVGVLDGIRSLGVLIVLWFHFWQQTWLMPAYRTPFLKWLGVSQIYPNGFRRCGYLCVDLMLLLSAFVLYLPYARQHVYGTPVDSIGRFFRKRVARIVPSYLLVVLVTFFVALAQGFYAGKPAFAWKDLLTHLTFTEMLFNDTYLFAGITAVVWTVCIEVMFYLIFPWLARAFQKMPLLVYAAMMLAGLAFTFGVALHISEPRIMVNRFLTFLPVFANGMMAAHLYVLYASRVKKKAIVSVIGMLAAIGACIVICRLFDLCAVAGKDQQIWQMKYRAVLSFAFTALVLGFAVAPRPFRRILDNRVAASVAAVTYNLYLWHQWLMVRLRIAFGAKSGADIAESGANTQWTLTLIALTVAFLTAIVITYGFEQPVSRLIMKERKGKGNARNK